MYYFNNKGTFSFKIKGNIPNSFGDKFIEFLMNEKFCKFEYDLNTGQDRQRYYIIFKR